MDLNNYAYNELYISDLHKDAHGWRCRIDFNNGQWTKESIDKFYDRLQTELVYTMEEEQQQEYASLLAYKAHIAKLMTEHNLTMEDAIRWDIQAEEEEILCEQDAEHYLWKKGLSLEDMEEFMPMVLAAKKVA